MFKPIIRLCTFLEPSPNANSRRHFIPALLLSTCKQWSHSTYSTPGCASKAFCSLRGPFYLALHTHLATILNSLFGAELLLGNSGCRPFAWHLEGSHLSRNHTRRNQLLPLPCSGINLSAESLSIHHPPLK